MTNSRELNDETKIAVELQQLRSQLSIANAEIAALKEQLFQSAGDLGRATDSYQLQRQHMRDLTDRGIADAAALAESTQTIERQNTELIDARRAVVLQTELEAANKELETFSYSVSHDLRSPLRAINGFAKALVEDYGSILPDEARRYLEHIENSAVRMGCLIDDLLSFSRLSRLDLSQVTLDMTGLVNSVWNDVKNDAADRAIEFHCPKTLPKIHADRALIKQVLINLLANAVKFTGKCPVAKISMTCTEEPSEFVFCVQDNGVGFDPRYADKLFGPFQRLHKAKDFPGTGIGLALVQRIIHRHGGRVWAESELNNGASFYFSIPKGEGLAT